MRIQVNLEEAMIDKVDAYAKALGVSRSAFCAFVVGQYVWSLEKGMETVGVSANEVLEKVAREFPDGNKPLV